MGLRHDPRPHIQSAGHSLADAMKHLRQFDNSEFPSLQIVAGHLNDAAIALVESRMLDSNHTLTLKGGTES